MRIRNIFIIAIFIGIAIIGLSLWLLVGVWGVGAAFTFFAWMSFVIQALVVMPAGGRRVTLLARRTKETLREGLAILPLRGILFDVAGATDPSKKLLKLLKETRKYITIFCCIIAIVQIFGHYVPSQTTRYSSLPSAIRVSPGETESFSVPAKSLGPVIFVEGLWVLDSSSAIVIVFEDGRRFFYSPGDKIDVGRHRDGFRVLNTSRTETVEVSIFSSKR